MKKLLLLFCIGSFSATAQDLCGQSGTLSSDIEAQIQANSGPSDGGCSYTVRLFIHLVRHSNGTGGQDASVIPTILNNLASVYNPNNIAFQYLGYDEILNDTYYNFLPKDAKYFQLIQINQKANAINMYLLDNQSMNGGVAVPGSNNMAMGGSYSVPGTNQAQLLVPSLGVAHEIGHCLGLYHTFESSFGDEFVNGSNCQTAGDLVCDTPAEPVDLIFTENSSCARTITRKDANGDFYNWIVTNIMNYCRPSCWSSFTNGQALRMKSTIGMGPDIAGAILQTPLYVGGVYKYGINTFGIYSANNGISVSSSANTVSIQLPNFGSATSYVWTVNNQSGSVNYSSNGRYANITLGGGATFKVTCHASNTCGSIDISFNCYNYSGTYRMAAYPNPANQDLSVAAYKSDDEQAAQADNQAAQSASTSSDQPINDKNLVDVDATVQLVDGKNQVIRNGKLEKGKLTFSTMDLPNGTYFLSIKDSEKTIQKQIVIQH